MQTTPKIAWILASLSLAIILLGMCNSAIAAQVPPPRATLPPPVEPLPGPERVEPEGGPIEPELLRALTEAEPDEHLRVIVHLREQADLKMAVDGVLSATEAHAHVVSALQATANQSQAPLLAYLAGASASGAVEHYTPFWIVNAVAVRADRDTVFAIAARPDVATIRLDHYRQWLPTTIPNSKSQTPNSQSAICNPLSGA
ncbi:MAG: protease inhibitor I9 family protein [Chloroflexi bacterium]|nr:protease inhibitor I9 family protein [Chloroflexota bacterium]